MGRRLKRRSPVRFRIICIRRTRVRKGGLYHIYIYIYTINVGGTEQPLRYVQTTTTTAAVAAVASGTVTGFAAAGE